MIVLLIISLISAAWSTSELRPELAHPLSDEFIDYINSVQNIWTAGRNFHPSTSMEYLKKLQGVIKSDSYKLPEKIDTLEDNVTKLPENFDARSKWPQCKSLNEIRDQGSCGSCWAIAAVAAMTDRVCIYSGGKQEFHFSTIDLATCCDFDLVCQGCNGGMPLFAWLYYNDTGIVSGGNYNSSTGCRPYPYRNCNHHQIADDGYPDCANVTEKNENCTSQCISKDINYNKDLKKAKRVYSIGRDEEKIKTEIYKNGPVEAGFTVYEDFLSYKKGVYKYTAGKEVGGHAVKILGWGVEQNVKYWLVANSWNEYWGDKGYFKILRGQNHCGIEGEINAGEPLLTVSSSPMEV